MIDVLSTMQVVLREAGFTTRLTSVDRFPVVCFEDDDLMGFGCVFADASALLARWKATEMSLLTRYGTSLRAAGDKAWNVYCLFLCGPDADATQTRQVRWIEEDLEHTRKVTGCGLASREDLVRAMLPLLPLRYQPELQETEVTARLQRRIRTIAPQAAEVVLKEDVAPVEVVRLLLGPA